MSDNGWEMPYTIDIDENYLVDNLRRFLNAVNMSNLDYYNLLITKYAKIIGFNHYYIII